MTTKRTTKSRSKNSGMHIAADPHPYRANLFEIEQHIAVRQ